MEPLTALLLIVGCSDDLVHCTELPAPASTYETMTACEDALPSAMRGHISSFPQIYAKCSEFDPELEEGNARLVWNINPEGDLIVSVEPARDYMVVSGIMSSRQN